MDYPWTNNRHDEVKATDFRTDIATQPLLNGTISFNEISILVQLINETLLALAVQYVLTMTKIITARTVLKNLKSQAEDHTGRRTGKFSLAWTPVGTK